MRWNLSCLRITTKNLPNTFIVQEVSILNDFSCCFSNNLLLGKMNVRTTNVFDFVCRQRLVFRLFTSTVRIHEAAHTETESIFQCSASFATVFGLVGFKHTT